VSTVGRFSNNLNERNQMETFSQFKAERYKTAIHNKSGECVAVSYFDTCTDGSHMFKVAFINGSTAVCHQSWLHGFVL